MHGSEEECMKDFSVKEGRRPLGRPIQRWKATIKMNLREIEWGCRLDSYGSGLEPNGGLL
jgi:hypothetical protein